MATAEATMGAAISGPEPQQAADVKREPEVNKLFRMVMKYEASDLHLKAGQPPMMRLKGVIRRMDMRALSADDMQRMLFAIMTDHHKKQLAEYGGADFAHI